MTGRFQSIVNKSMTDAAGRRYVQVMHKGQLYKVNIARTEQELREVKEFDNKIFTGPQKIGMKELKAIRDFGVVLTCCNDEEVLAISQILLSSIRAQEVRRHEAFLYGTAGRHYGQVMFKAQEVVAREFGKERMRMTVRVENTEMQRAALKAGFRIVEYDPTRYGAQAAGGGRLIMEKNLITEQFPFEPHKQAELLVAGEIAILDSLEATTTLLQSQPEKIAVHVRNENRIELTAHQIIEQIMKANYFGIGLVQPEEIGEKPGSVKLLIFQRLDLPPRGDRLAFPLQVHSEFGRLREVVVSYTPENAQIKAEYAINDVARMNVNNMDPIAVKDEYNLFVGTLVAHDVNVVHSNALGKDGKSAIFTRDPAFVLGNTFLIGQLGQKQRMYESDGMRQVADGRVQLELSGDPEAVVEGGDVIFLEDRVLAVGQGQRSNAKGLAKLQAMMPDYRFIAVPHSDLHLDVLFTMVAPRMCLADVTRLPQSFLDWLREQQFTVVEADPEEQVSLGCNVFCLDQNKVLAAKENENTNQRLRDKGVEVVEVSMPNIVKWGGGPRCMTCPTNRDL